MTQHQSVWLATADLRPQPRLERDLDVDVVVVGGGIVGLTAALLAQRDGARVALLEADRVGAGTTGHTTGKVTTQHTLVYASLLRRFGREKARQYADANVAGMQLVTELVRTLHIDCDLERAPALAYTRRARLRRQVEDEVRAARELGLSASLTDTTDLPFAVEAAARFDDQVLLHPGRYVAGLVDALTSAGGLVFEHSRVVDIGRESGDAVRVTTASGVVHAGAAVVATLLPLELTGGLFARTRPTRAYGIAVRLRGPAPRSMAISVESPVRSTRPWNEPGDHGLIIVGNSHETGSRTDTVQMQAELDAWARSTFDVESIDYRWSAQDYTTADGVPYVGRSPASRHVYVATGFRKWGLSNGTAAAIMLADLLAGRENGWLPMFDARRVGDVKALARYTLDNLHVGAELVGGHLRARFEARPTADLRRGEGGVVEVDGAAVGAYRDPAGRLHAVDPTCTHLKCRVRWNGAETSWDCPCHGSRFDVDGSVLTGPAVQPLRRIDLDRAGPMPGDRGESADRSPEP